MQCKLSLQEKLELVKQLDAEILELVEECELEEEIGQAGEFKERICRVMIDLTSTIEMKQATQTPTLTTSHIHTP